MVIFNSYVKLPEGNFLQNPKHIEEPETLSAPCGARICSAPTRRRAEAPEASRQGRTPRALR